MSHKIFRIKIPKWASYYVSFAASFDRYGNKKSPITILAEIHAISCGKMQIIIPSNEMADLFSFGGMTLLHNFFVTNKPCICKMALNI